MHNANEDLFDATTIHRLELLRFEAGAVQEVLARYTAAIAPIMQRLDELRREIAKDPASVSPIDVAQIGPLRRGLTDEIKKARAEITAILDEAQREAAGVALEEAFGSIRAAVPSSVLVQSVATVDAVVAATEVIGGRHWHDRLAVDLLAVHDELQAALTLGAQAGLSVPNLARAIDNATGIAQTYRGRLTAIARTEIQRVSNDAAMAVYRQNTNVLKGVQYLATLDSRTCVRCAPFHNRYFEFDAAGVLPADAPTLPLHPRCRCFYAPVTKSWREMGIDVDDPAERRRLDGSRPENTTFDAWLKKRSSGVQDEILGPERAQLWRDGVPLERFSDARRVIPLGELRAALER